MASDGESTDQVEVAARTLLASRYVIALCGAGMSVESGIRPFRGKGGLWTEKGEPPMDGYQRFMRDPESAWRDMLARRAANDEFARSLSEAAPNEGHLAMAELERMGVLKHTITQNIDDLHFVAGSVAVTEIHGNRTKVRCIACGARWPWAEFTVEAVPPRCPQCGGVVKSDTVMFGEPIPSQFLRECNEQAGRADCILVVGTSATVYPAAGFAEQVVYAGGALIEVNIDPTPFSPYAAAVLRGTSATLLPPLVARLKEIL